MALVRFNPLIICFITHTYFLSCTFCTKYKYLYVITKGLIFNERDLFHTLNKYLSYNDIDNTHYTSTIDKR